MTLERCPSAMDDARAACRRRESTGTRGAVGGFPVISMRLALFFVALSLAPRAAWGEGNLVAGESGCSSDSDCYENKKCAGGVCCYTTASHWGQGYQNCTQCQAAAEEGSAQCTQCLAGVSERFDTNSSRNG